MANKKTNVNLKGILNNLEEDTEEHQEQTKIEEPKQDAKKKNRSFMLTDNTIKKLKELNFILDKDLSSIVTEAIEEYYSAHQKDINNTLK